jgi:hypothetical protein
MAYRITLENCAGELDARVVMTEDEIRDAAAELVSGSAYLSPGDLVRIVECDDPEP